MEHKFKILTTKKEIDLIPYIQQYILQHPTTQLLIGTDSQNKRKITVYATCIALNRPGKGAHVLYTKHEIPRIKDNNERLINETWKSIEIAEYIRENTGIRAQFLDIDINPDPIYKSNAVLSQSVGMIKGMGYNVRNKRQNVVMTYAADSLIK